MARELSPQQVPPGLRMGFIGSGQMAQAIAKGLVAAGLVGGGRITASNPSDHNLELMSRLGANTTHDNKAVLPSCDVVVLCVKPHILPGVLQEVAPHVTNDHLVISVVTGVDTEQLDTPMLKDRETHSSGAAIKLLNEQMMLGRRGRVIRMVPNTPCLVRCGVTAFCAGARSTPDDCVLTRTLFASLGVCSEIQERLLDVITALCGSGPAYIFQVIEALADGAVKMGLPRTVAQQLAAQTVKGAATLVEQTGKHPGELKDAVCSPGGTTIAGIHKLERGGLRATIMDAVEASTEKAVELGNKSRRQT